jgi:hypothetical protein
LLERLFGEERRRTKVIFHAFDERAVLNLMYAALIGAAERWRAIEMTEFERRGRRNLHCIPAALIQQGPGVTAPRRSLPRPFWARFDNFRLFVKIVPFHFGLA